MNKKVDMLISTLNRIKDVSLKFKNPSFNHYFSKKVNLFILYKFFYLFVIRYLKF